MKRTLISTLALGALLAATNLQAEQSAAEQFFVNPKQGDLKFSSVGRLAFGPSGLLLIGDPRSASVVALDTKDTGPVTKLQKRVDDIEALFAARLGAPAKDVKIIDMAVNPASGKTYFSVQRGNDPVLMVVGPNGKARDFDYQNSEYLRITLPEGDSAKLRNLTDLAFAEDRIIIAGQSSEEFANKIFSVPVPLKGGVSADYVSAETYHVAHGRWETKAPIQSFIPYEENGQQYVVGAFACTPIAKFPISDLKNGGKIKGTSVVELGSGNRPRDMFTYSSGGKNWVVTNTQRFKTKLGPSAYWGARVDMNYLALSAPDAINENAARRDYQNTSGPGAKGIEVVDELFGAILVSQLNGPEVVVLREDGDKKALELTRLP